MEEGGRQALLRSHLDIVTPQHSISQLTYNITRGPHHGSIDIMEAGTMNVLRKSSPFFTSRELLTERVFYVHDDSETHRDSFHFVALSSEAEDFQYVGVFHVDVVLKNDNTPYRAIEKVFRVVTNGERLITGRDLKYSDADLDTKPSDLVYTRRGVPNGGIYKASEPSVELFEFTQEDLNQNRVLFRHEGADYGKVGLWITDGQFYANGVLEVRASTPFIEVTNNSGLVVQHGETVYLTADNLTSETNLNLWGEQIVYQIIESPSHGVLEIDRRQKPLNVFTQADLDHQLVFYKHDGSAYINDHFVLRVEAGSATTKARINIRVFPASYWEPLQVMANKTIHVEESTSVVISSSYLKVRDDITLS